MDHQDLPSRHLSPVPDRVIKSSSGVAFEVASVTPATTVLPEISYKDAIENLLQKPPSPLTAWRDPQPSAVEPFKPVESCSSYHDRLVAGIRFHPVVAAIHAAFDDHRPLVLSPDIIWFLIAQGFANHVNANAEELRSKVVRHSGKASIVVQRDDFVKGSPENPWPEVFDEFSSQIRRHIGEATHDLLLPDFSTTGTVEKAASQVVLMDAMKSFFSYEFRTRCGIPHIALEGTTEDWEKLADRMRGIGRFGLEWWTEVLSIILDQFIAASQGRGNARFWQSIYKVEAGSGGIYTSGWITAFFPYLKEWQTGRATQRNYWLTEGGEKLQELLYPAGRGLSRFSHGPTTEQYPGGLTRAPFLWKYLSHTYEMEFLGGFVGVRQEPDNLWLRPEIGWAVREATRSQQSGPEADK